jgi:8-oxo-dGTP diphosphatase
MEPESESPIEPPAVAYRDSTARRLTDYPRPAVAVDTAVLTVAPLPVGGVELAVLQVRRTGGHQHGSWALPGTFLHPGERLIDAVHRSLRDKAGVIGGDPTQLHVFDDPDRDDRGWVLSVAHLDALPHARLVDALAARDDLRLTAASDPGPLPYDHTHILTQAVAHLRDRYTAQPDPDRFLPTTFTLRELRLTHEAVAGTALQRDTFRRTMTDHLTPTGTPTAGTRGRPAELFRRR